MCSFCFQKKKKKDMAACFFLEIIYSRLVLKNFKLSFLHIPIHCNNVFMYVIPIVY